MYCIKCGVRLSESEKICPLCATRVFHPDLALPQGEPPYPQGKYPAVPRRSQVGNAILIVLFLLPILITMVADLQLNRAITWSGIVAGAILLGYIALVLPFWFRKPNPVIFIPIDFAAAGVYLLYIDLISDGSWFLSFAFPVTGAVGLIVTAAVVLLKYVPKSALFTLGGAFLALGAFMPVMEFLLNHTFGLARGLIWSIYAMVTLALVGGLLIFLGAYRPAREMLERKLFI